MSTTTATSGCCAVSRRVVSVPSKKGMCRSSRIASGRLSATSSRASSPLAAAPDNLDIGEEPQQQHQALADTGLVVGHNDPQQCW